MPSVINKIGFFIKKVFLLPIIFYQKVLGPHLPKVCLYKPSCSEYFRLSVMKFGIIRGAILGTARIFRCFGLLFEGGEDEVPEKFSFKAIGDGYKKFRKVKKDKDV